MTRTWFGSLYARYARCPEVDVPSAERIAAAMHAFAAGDAPDGRPAAEEFMGRLADAANTI